MNRFLQKGVCRVYPTLFSSIAISRLDLLNALDINNSLLIYIKAEKNIIWITYMLSHVFFLIR